MSKGKKVHNTYISFRLPTESRDKMMHNIIKKSYETKTLYNVSTYLRDLIEKDYCINEK